MALKVDQLGRWGITIVLGVVLVIAMFYWAFKRLSPGPTGYVEQGVRSSDARLAAAEAEAKRRYPEFLELYRSRGPDDQFFVKGHVTQGFLGEWLWVKVNNVSNDGKTITGTIDSQPTRIRNVTVGDMVIVKKDHISDWLYEGPVGRRGGFTEKVLEEGLAPRPGTTGPDTRPATAPATQPENTR